MKLTGRIYQDEDGLFVSVCNEIAMATGGETLEQALSMTVDLIKTHFEACERLGPISGLPVHAQDVTAELDVMGGKWTKTVSLHP